MLDRILDDTDADLYLQVGDIGDSTHIEELKYPELSKPVYFIAGNHEDWNELEPMLPTPSDKIFEMRRNLWHIPTGHYCDLKGLRIVGFGNNYAPSRFNWPRSNLQQDRRRHFTKSDLERTLEISSCDILLTHEAPTPFIIRNNEDAGIVPITTLIYKLKPKLHFFGHHHFYRELKIGDTESYCIPIEEYRIFEV